MIRKLTALLLFMALMAPMLAVSADSTIPPYNTDGKAVNWDMVRSYHWLIYGDPANVSGNEQKVGQWRYLGYTYDSNPFSNPYFPNDADSGRDPWQKDWIPLPWTVKEITSKYSVIKASMNDDDLADLWIDQLTPSWPGWDTSRLLDTLVIMSPPGPNTPGAARGFHTVGGKVWYQTFVLAPLNEVGVGRDLAVADLIINDGEALEAGQEYTGTFKIYNYTLEYANQIPLKIYADGELIADKLMDLRPTGAKSEDAINTTFSFTVPEDWAAESTNFRVELNMVEPRTFEEYNSLEHTPLYGNNVIDAVVGFVTDDPLDLEVTKISAGQFFTGQAGDITVYVKNNSLKTDVSNIPVRLIIDGQSLAPKNISLAPGASTQVLFKVTPPAGSSGFSVTGEVNNTKVVSETTYTNNKRSTSVNITGPAIPPSCSEPTVTWTEYRSVDAYDGGDKIEDHYIQERHSERYSYTKADGTTGHRTRVWYTPKLVGYTVRFKLTLHASVSVTPGTIKSGYGVDTLVKTSISTNYDKTSSLSNAQNVWAYFPDSPIPVKLQAVEGSPSSASGTVSWRLPQTVTKALLTRKHYIPVSWPDGSYAVRIVATDVSGPGDPCRSASTTIKVSGNMHEDDYTGAGGR